MDAATRAALERELKALDTYVHTVRTEGPEYFLTPNRPGWRVTLLSSSEIVGRKRAAIARVWAEADACTRRASEIRARIEAAEWDAERAAVPEAERLAAAQAERDAMDRRPFRSYTPRHVAMNRLTVGRRIA